MLSVTQRSQDAVVIASAVKPLRDKKKKILSSCQFQLTLPRYPAQKQRRRQCKVLDSRSHNAVQLYHVSGVNNENVIKLKISTRVCLRSHDNHKDLYATLEFFEVLIFHDFPTWTKGRTHKCSRFNLCFPRVLLNWEKRPFPLGNS